MNTEMNNKISLCILMKILCDFIFIDGNDAKNTFNILYLMRVFFNISNQTYFILKSNNFEARA